MKNTIIAFNNTIHKINTYAKALLSSVSQDVLIKKFIRMNATVIMYNSIDNIIELPDYDYKLDSPDTKPFIKAVK